MDVLIRTQVEGDTSQGLDALLITVRQAGTTFDSSEQTLNGGRNPFALNAADDPDNLLPEWYFLFDGEAGTDIAVGDTITADAKAWYCTVDEVGYFADTATGYVGVTSLRCGRAGPRCRHPRRIGAAQRRNDAPRRPVHRRG